MQPGYKISNLLPATEAVLMNDVYLVLLYATRVPPHLLVSVNGKIFTLSVKGATVDGELPALLTLIRRKNIETIFIRLALPPLFTLDQLSSEIRSCTLAYPRADIGIATCLTPIKDFCHSIYDTESLNVNLIFDLLPKLQERNAMKDCYQMNLNNQLIPDAAIGTGLSPDLRSHPTDVSGEGSKGGTLSLNIYEVNDVYEAIRKSSLAMV